MFSYARSSTMHTKLSNITMSFFKHGGFLIVTFMGELSNKKAGNAQHTTPSCKSGLDFRLVLGMPLCQGGCMGPIWPETEVGQIISAHPPEIGAPVTPGVSHGTKIFGSKIFSYHPQMMLFYVFCGFVLQKMLKIEKNCLFLALFPITKKSCKNRQFSLIFCIFCKTNPQNT